MNLRLLAPTCLLLATISYAQNADDAGSIQDTADAGTKEAELVVTASFNFSGTATRERVLTGHIEGSVSVNRVEAFFILKPSPGCVFVSDQTRWKLDYPRTYNSNIISRRPAMGTSPVEEIRIDYFSEGCHGFLGFSCGWGYLNLDYAIPQACREPLEPFRTVRKYSASELAAGVQISHQDCQRPATCSLAQGGFWTISVRDGGDKKCSVDPDGPIPAGLQCRATDLGDGSLTLTVN